MENDKYSSLTDEQLLKKKSANKTNLTYLMAALIVMFLLASVVFGYYIGADIATGGKGNLHYKPLLPFLFIFPIAYYLNKKEQNEIEEEIKKRNL
jgi:hypothetical protein